jgi:hypothetical protein
MMASVMPVTVMSCGLMPAAPVIMRRGVIITTAQTMAVDAVGQDGRGTAQHQACGKQEGLKQCAGFHENDSFLACLMKQ